MRSAIARGVIFLVMVTCGMWIDLSPLRAQTLEIIPGQSPDSEFSPASTGPYITKTRERYNVFVFGDDFGDGLWAGLVRVLSDKNRFRIIRRSKSGTGFARDDVYDWNASLAKILERNRVDIAVVMIGSNDSRSIRTPNKRFRIGSPNWQQVYASRVDRFVDQLRRHGAAIYWIGLPIMKKPSYDRSIQFINAMHKQRVEFAGARFISIRQQFADEKGAYTQFGFDLEGEMRRLRSKDGVALLKRGNQKLASMVVRRIRADIAEAERAGQSGSWAEDTGRENGVTVVTLPAEQGADTSPAGESGSPFSGNVRLRRGRRPKARQEHGKSDLAHSPLVRNLEPDSLAAQVLIRGKIPDPKPGRADDFSWPKQQ